MFERFTDRARKIIALANQEAQRFNSQYIGTEHILLGMLKEGSGVAASALKSMEIDLRKVRLETEKLVKCGPDIVTMGKLPQTPRSKKVIEFAVEEARNLHHDYVGSEHILLGLLRESDGIAAQILMNLGIKSEDVRKAVLELLDAKKSGEELDGLIGIEIHDIVRYKLGVLGSNPLHCMSVVDIRNGSKVQAQRFTLEIDALLDKSVITIYEVGGNKRKAYFAGFTINMTCQA